MAKINGNFSASSFEICVNVYDQLQLVLFNTDSLAMLLRYFFLKDFLISREQYFLEKIKIFTEIED